jgi:hypothetical protein
VVNGFFWAGKPVPHHDQGVSHATALGVSSYEYSFNFFL